MTAVFDSQLCVRDPICTEIKFKRQIELSGPCYSVAWCGGKIVSGVGSSLQTYDVDGSNVAEYLIACDGLPCIRNAGDGNLAVLIYTKGGNEREVRISQIQNMSSPDSVVCKFKQENSTVTHISVSSTHIAACDHEAGNIIIFNIKGEQIMVVNSTKGLGNRCVLLIEDSVLAYNKTAKCLSRYPLESNAEPVWSYYGLEYISGICTDKDGLIYAASASVETGGRIHLISPEGFYLIASFVLL